MSESTNMKCTSYTHWHTHTRL